jgi:RNA polymerase sigma-70 factor (ECF subfamily)
VNPASDDELLSARVRGGDLVAYETLFRAWHARLVRYAASLLDDGAAAEDVVQTVFLRIWQNRASFAIRTSLSAYLYTAVRNGALNGIARRRTERDGWQQAVQEQLARRGAALPPTPLDALESADIAAVVRRAIDRLPARRREALILRWDHGLSHAEIARTLGISVKGVENHITRALKSLREQFGDEDPR